MKRLQAVILLLWTIVKLKVANGALVPAYFVLGDSLVDAGNNNHLFTLARSDFQPYGSDFDTHLATGRFSNGRTAADYLTELLGLPFLPPSLHPTTTGNAILKGVNFASAGCGILNFTGKIFGQNMPLEMQLQRLVLVRQQIFQLLGEQRGRDLFATSLFSIVIGSNDYLNNYLVKLSEEAALPPDQFQALLLTTFKSQLQRLYDLGVRRFHVVGIPAIGCCPQSLFKFGSKNGECIEWVNELAVSYNAGLLSLLEELRSAFHNSQIVYTDSYFSFMEIYQNPQKYGFKVTADACCGIGEYGGSFFCLPGIPFCTDAKEHIFFDEFHPTSRVAQSVAEKAFSGGPEVNVPISIQQMLSI